MGEIDGELVSGTHRVIGEHLGRVIQIAFTGEVREKVDKDLVMMCVSKILLEYLHELARTNGVTLPGQKQYTTDELMTQLFNRPTNIQGD